MPRVVHFEIYADDVKQAINFYQKVFGWEINQWGSEDYWLITTGPDNEPGINGGLLKRRGGQKGDAVIAYVCTIDVPSVDDYVAWVQSNGGSVALPKMPVPGVGWLAYCKDTDGNIFGMMQADPEAQ